MNPITPVGTDPGITPVSPPPTVTPADATGCCACQGATTDGTYIVTCVGGDPVLLAVPASGSWYLVADSGLLDWEAAGGGGLGAPLPGTRFRSLPKP